MRDRPGPTRRIRVHTVTDGNPQVRRDTVATEEPLELRLVSAAGQRQTLAITMRTPGNDFALAAGFLHGEGVVTAPEQIARISYCTDPDVDPEQLYNIVNVTLTAETMPELRGLERHFATTSACGVCGKASLDALKVRGVSPLRPGATVTAATLYALPEVLREAQSLFATTGGLHAAALFTTGGELLHLQEDVGRHNAVDKLVGRCLLAGELPLTDRVLLVSGRASYEIMQKALVAGVPIVCAVSAPSSLAVSLAEEFGMTLVGFLRERRCNVYTGSDRIVSSGARGRPFDTARS